MEQISSDARRAEPVSTAAYEATSRAIARSHHAMDGRGGQTFPRVKHGDKGERKVPDRCEHTITDINLPTSS